MNRRSTGYRLSRTLVLAGVMPFLSTSAEPQTDRGETFEGSAEVVLVEVPVRVLLNGVPVTGLIAADFEVYDRGDLQQITHFEVVDFRSTEDDESGGQGVPTFGGRYFLVVLDLAYPARAGLLGSGATVSGVRNLLLNVRSLGKFLSAGIGPHDRWALAYHSPLRGVKLLQSWTSDSGAIQPTLKILEAIALAQPARVEEGLDEWRSLRTNADGVPEGLVPTDEDLVAEARTASVRADPFLPQLPTIENLSNGLTELTGALGQITGTRHLIYVSRGFPLGEDGTSAPILNRLQSLFRDFRSSGWSIEAINPIGAEGGGGSLFLIAHETGGQLHTTSGELSELLGRVTAHTAYSYVLGYNPTDLEADGRYHKLKIKLVEPLKSTRVVHRRGYYAPEASEDNGSSQQPGAGG